MSGKPCFHNPTRQCSRGHGGAWEKDELDHSPAGGGHERHMFITVYTYRARAPDPERTIELHFELSRNPAWHGPGFVSGELLQCLEDPQEFVEITRYEDEHSARETTRRPEYTAWCARLMETLELGPSFSHFRRAVQSQPDPSPAPRAATKGD
jgi:heme-degrading monooxygenase HmoA